MIAVASGVASADTILETQTQTGTLPSFSSPPTPNTNTATFAGFDQTAANNSIVCPVGFTCGTAVLYEIDLGLSANTSGQVTVSNSNPSNQNIYCISAVNGDTCSGSGATATNGVSVAGTINLDVVDPNMNEVLAFNNAPTFTVATTNVSGSNAGRKNYIIITGSAGVTGMTTYSGTGNPTDPISDIYDSTNDPTWSADSAAYIGGTVTLDLTLSGNQEIGSAATGVNPVSSSASITGGTVTADYLFSYTETSNSTTPEPTTMVLMGGALLGIGLIRKRKANRA